MLVLLSLIDSDVSDGVSMSLAVGLADEFLDTSDSSWELAVAEEVQDGWSNVDEGVGLVVIVGVVDFFRKMGASFLTVTSAAVVVEVAVNDSEETIADIREDSLR
jgi:hypothetical protein